MTTQTDPDQIAFIERMDAWLAATGTNFTCLCRAAGVHTSLRFFARHGIAIKADLITKVNAAMAAHPDGITPPQRKADSAKRIPESDLQARRDAVRREREQRVRELLAKEKPGLNGKRRSMRPIWEMTA
jgi:enamine deaminase RidA (YjgF/YER057c/UK114 family)